MSSPHEALRMLADAPRWPPARTEALEGDVDGVMLKAWAMRVDRRHGRGASRRVRAALGPLAEAIPDAPQLGQRLAVAQQLRLTETIAEELHGGDLAALAAAVRDDFQRDIPLAGRLGLRAYGAERALRRAPDAHARLYGDAGEVAAEVAPGQATITYSGAPLFAHPTWRLIVVTALAVMVESGAGHPARDVELAPDPEALRVRLRW